MNRAVRFARRDRAPRRMHSTPQMAVVLALIVVAACLETLDVGSAWARGLVLHMGLVAIAVMATAAMSAAAATRRHEQAMWLWTRRGMVVVAAGALASGLMWVLSSAGVPVGPFVVAPLMIALVAAAPCCYRGLLHWNRLGTAMAAPGDWLNGLTAGLTVVGLGVAIMDWTGASDASGWRSQLWLAVIAAVVVLAGTAATAAKLGGLLQDPRVWMVTGAWCLVGCADVVFGVSGNADASGSWGFVCCAGALVLIAGAAVRRSRAGDPLDATPQATAIGTMVVQVAAVLLLVLGNRPGFQSLVPTIYGLLAVIGTSVRTAGLVRDLAQLAQARLQATTDELTGIGNRRALMNQLRLLQRQRTPVALLIADLNRFKDVNDSYGHSVGDELLRQAATRLQRQIPAGGLVARMSGDKFAMVLSGDDASSSTTTSLAEAAVRVMQQTIDIDGRRLNINIKVGVAIVEHVPEDPAELLRRTDTALYTAKRSDDDVRFYDHVTHLANLERLTLLSELRAVLSADEHVDDPDEIVVFYQPQIDLRTREVAGVEALVRWANPRSGFLPPDAFLDLAEEYGLMQALTARVLRLAADQAVLWHRGGSPLRVSVNISASCLAHPTLLPMLDNVLDTTGIDPGLLTVEVTETAVMGDPQRSLAITHEITGRGIGLSIDDYGTGHATLAYLNDLPATELKIDRSFIARMRRDERTAAIVAATIELAHRLQMRVVAEGIEDEDTDSALTALGCDESQGFLYARPMPADLLTDWLSTRPTRVARAT